MSIIGRKFYGISCDCCGTTLSDAWGQTIFIDNAPAVEELAISENWKKVNDKHYCEDCYHYEEDNKLILHDKKQSTRKTI